LVTIRAVKWLGVVYVICWVITLVVIGYWVRVFTGI
jgi:hypothetical protein